MVGRKLAAVTLEQSRMALTTNFLKVEMTRARDANQSVDLEIGGVSAGGLIECDLVQIG
jgi:hypothetical protein